MNVRCVILLAAVVFSLSAAGCVLPADTTSDAGSLTGAWNVVSDAAGSGGVIAPAESVRSFSVLSQSDRLFLVSWNNESVPGGLFNQDKSRLIFDAGTPELRNLVYGMLRNDSLMLASATYNRSTKEIGAECILAARENAAVSLPEAFSIAGTWKTVSAEQLEKDTYSELLGTFFSVENESDGVILGTFEVDILGVVHERAFAGSLSYVSPDGSSVWYNVVTGDGEFWKLNAVRMPAGVELTFWTVAISESGSGMIATVKRVFTRDGTGISPAYEYPDMRHSMVCRELAVLSGGKYLTLENSDAMVRDNESVIQHDGLVYLSVAMDGEVNNYWDMGQYLTYVSPTLFETTSASSSRKDGSVMMSEGWYETSGKLSELHLASNGKIKAAEFVVFSNA